MDQETVLRRRWLIMCVLVLSLVIVILDNTILNVALPSISRELGASQAELTGAILSYAVVFGSLQFSAGVLGDRWGRKRILLIGLVIFGLTSLAASQAADPTQLIVLRGFMAVGAAMIPAQTLSILTNVFPPQERARAIGIWAGFTGAAIALGPILGGLLLQYFWWGSIFFINVPIVVLSLVLTTLLVPDSKNPRPGRLDPVGILLSAVGLGAVVFGLIYGGEYRAWTEFWSLGMILVGVATLGLFIWWELHTPDPSFDVRFFRNPRFSAASGSTAMAFFALFGVSFFLTFYFQFVRGLTALQAGACILPLAVAQVLFAPRAPRLVRLIGVKYTVGMGLLILSIALMLFTQVQTDTPFLAIFAILFLIGAGMAHIVAPATESVMSSVPLENAGAGSAVNNTTRQVSGAMGIAVFGTLLQIVYSRSIVDALEVLPADVRDQAQRSIGDTYVVVGQLFATDPAAAGRATQALGCGDGQGCAAGQAYMNGVHVTAFLASLVALAAVAIVMRYLPVRPVVGPGEAAEPVAHMLGGHHARPDAVAMRPTASEAAAGSGPGVSEPGPPGPRRPAAPGPPRPSPEA